MFPALATITDYGLVARLAIAEIVIGILFGCWSGLRSRREPGSQGFLFILARWLLLASWVVPWAFFFFFAFHDVDQFGRAVTYGAFVPEVVFALMVGGPAIVVGVIGTILSFVVFGTRLSPDATALRTVLALALALTTMAASLLAELAFLTAMDSGS